MDAFYASVEQLLKPELRGKPVVVGHDGPRGVVAAASYEARRFGVRSAMPSAVARRLCPQAVFVGADFATYRRYSALVFEVMSRYTPIIEPLSLDEAFMDLSGDRDTRAAPKQAALRLKAEVRAATGGLACSVGVATCKVVAKVASDLRKPDGLVIVPPGTEAAFLAPLALEVLPGLGPAAQRKVADIGLRTVGDLAALPPTVVEARLGRNGLGLLAMARGDDPRPVVVPGQPKSISREVTFERDVLDLSSLRATARTLALDVARSLRGQGLWARTVRLKLRFEDFETHTYQSTLEGATDLDDDFLACLDRLLADALPHPRPIRLVGVGATGLVEARQEDLFGDDGRTRRRQLDQAVDALRKRFGPAAVARGPEVTREQKDFRREDIDSLRRGEPGA